MCYMCILIKESLPSPRAFVNTSKELGLDEKHAEEVFNKVVEKLPEDERKEFINQVVTEYFNDYLRNT